MLLQFWNFASNTTGHPEWLEQYGNAKTIEKDPSKYLLLQKSVATEFSRFKFAVGSPKVSINDSVQNLTLG